MITMTCKDCIHYDMCEILPFTEDKGKECDYFKDKSRFIERLFDVGDKVYQTDDEGRIYEMTINRIEYYKGTKQLVYETCAISFDNDAVGHSIFGTKEEAEKRSEKNER